MAELWTPGGHSADDFVPRVHQQIARFAEAHGLDKAMVEIVLRDGSRLVLDTIAPEPGLGFITLRPHPEDGGDPEELIVPVGSVAQIRISPTEEEPQFGFVLPEETPGEAAP
jgi:hypothetical protein